MTRSSACPSVVYFVGRKEVSSQLVTHSGVWRPRPRRWPPPQQVSGQRRPTRRPTLPPARLTGATATRASFLTLTHVALHVRYAGQTLKRLKVGESEADFYASARGSTGTVRPVCREEGGASRRRGGTEGVRAPAHRGRSGQRGVDVATVLPTKLKQTCKKNPTSESSGRRTGEWKR